jgi:hypothetical protein
MSGLKFGAISIGVIVDISTSLIFGALFGAVMMAFLLARGLSAADAQAQIENNAHAPIVEFLGLGLGGLGSLIGGFVTGWLAKYHRVLNGAAAGILSTLIGLIFGGQDPLWLDVLGVICTIGPATSGAYLSQLVFGHTRPPAPPLIVHP